jgi:hypothetical protein
VRIKSCDEISNGARELEARPYTFIETNGPAECTVSETDKLPAVEELRGAASFGYYTRKFPEFELYFKNS